MTTILLFDFDGTIALGDGPVLAYARHVATALGASERFVDDVRVALAAAGPDAVDGYDVVRRAADSFGADGAVLSAAYLASRAQLATAAAPVTVPSGLVEFLRTAGPVAERVLVTNAPAVRLPEALEHLGLAGLFDRIVTDARKPAGMEEVLDALPPDARILSIGDMWRNDLAPAHARGHATALIGGFADPAATPTFRAADFATLAPQLEAWLRATDSSVPSTSHTLTTEG